MSTMKRQPLPKVGYCRGYNDTMNPDQQITMEEQIAAYCFDTSEVGEETAAKAGRDILLMILTQFRPDLFEPRRSPR